MYLCTKKGTISRMQKTKPTLEVKFFREINGSEPVRKWLQSLEKALKIKIGEDISKVQFRWPLGMPLVRSLGGGMHELRCHVQSGIIRILFIVKGKRMVLLHGFVKKTQKLPIQEFELAKQRMSMYEKQEEI